MLLFTCAPGNWTDLGDLPTCVEDLLYAAALKAFGERYKTRCCRNLNEDKFLILRHIRYPPGPILLLSSQSSKARIGPCPNSCRWYGGVARLYLTLVTGQTHPPARSWLLPSSPVPSPARLHCQTNLR